MIFHYVTFQYLMQWAKLLFLIHTFLWTSCVHLTPHITSCLYFLCPYPLLPSHLTQKSPKSSHRPNSLFYILPVSDFSYQLYAGYSLLCVSNPNSSSQLPVDVSDWQSIISSWIPGRHPNLICFKPKLTDFLHVWVIHFYATNLPQHLVA